jgi:hypothetical protein
LFGFIRKAIRVGDKVEDEPAAMSPQKSPLLRQDEEEIPRYPPFMKGLPATPPQKLIETQRDLIGQIREAGLASPDIFEQVYLASLRRFSSYAHLLPASQTHHHRGAGGLLRHAGWLVNDKRVERIWRREGLKVPYKQPKRGRLWLTDGSCIRLRPEHRNHVWSYDFVEDRTHDGRKYRMLNVVDEFTQRAWRSG